MPLGETCGRCERGGRADAPDPDCPECHGWGERVLVTCPYAAVPPETYDVLEAVDLAEARTWPVAGGWLDQAQSFLDAFRFVRAERARQRAAGDERPPQQGDETKP